MIPFSFLPSKSQALVRNARNAVTFAGSKSYKTGSSSLVLGFGLSVRNMASRRSTRQSTSSEVSEVPNAGAVKAATAPVKKRARKSRTTEGTAADAVAQNRDTAAGPTSMPPPPGPQTPVAKRRRVAGKDAAPPPFTPTPSAIGLMTSTSNIKRNYSTGDIDDATPPPPDSRPVEPHHTNATLVTPGGTQVTPSYGDFDDSPSKPAQRPLTTSTDLLKDACAHLISIDPKLKPVIDQHHCRIFSAEGLTEEIDPFRALVSGILAQQVSGAAAKSIKNKFIALFPPESCPNGFPPPKIVAQSTVPRLREAGLSQRKAEYVQGLAEKFASGELNVDMLMNGSDEEVMEKLVAVRGLGAWSVEMFMCFALKRMDIFSTGDLGVQRGMAAYVGKDVAKLKAKGGGKWKYMSEKDMLDTSEKFKPYRTLFMWYMWRIEDVDVAALQND